MRLHASARKHFARDRLTDDAVLYAAHHDPRRWILLGYDPAGRILELVVLVFDSADDPPLVIHAMKARPQYLDAL